VINIRYSFTGTTNPNGSSPKLIEHVIRNLEDVTQVNTGAAVGVDTYAYEYAVEFFPQAEHRVYVPKGKFHNSELVHKAEENGHRVILIPGGYMARNDALVANADILIGFPQTAAEVLRSGTWATIRRGRKVGISVRIHPVG
jgi:hypothetical protein